MITLIVHSRLFRFFRVSLTLLVPFAVYMVFRHFHLTSELVDASNGVLAVEQESKTRLPNLQVLFVCAILGILMRGWYLASHIPWIRSMFVTPANLIQEREFTEFKSEMGKEEAISVPSNVGIPPENTLNHGPSNGGINVGSRPPAPTRKEIMLEALAERIMSDAKEYAEISEEQRILYPVADYGNVTINQAANRTREGMLRAQTEMKQAIAELDAMLPDRGFLANNWTRLTLIIRRARFLEFIAVFTLLVSALEGRESSSIGRL